MRKTTFKIIMILTLAFIMPLLYGIINYNVQAADFDPNPYVAGIDNENSSGTEMISNIGKIIVGIFRGLGTVVSVAILVIIGMKYMLGSVEEKAEYKKSLPPYLIGAILVFGITTILPLICAIAKA